MTRLYALVEGPTEEGFVKEVLASHLQNLGVWVYPVIVETSRDASGRKRRGGGYWKNWKRDLTRLTRQQAGGDIRITTMFDLYGLPEDFPDLATHASNANITARVHALEAAMAKAVNDHRFIPYIQRHEFEALVLAALKELKTFLDAHDDLVGVDQLMAVVQTTAPEDINDGAETAPSKRLEAHIPGYQKTVHGPLAVASAGLTALRAACPHFGAWVTRLEALGASHA
jgi:Domain of unknown function (DUF4276)